MITSQNLKTITDMRKDADGLLKLAKKKKEPIGILKNNKLKAYLIDAQTLESLEAFVEDYLDYKMVKKRLEKAKKEDFVEFEEFLKD
jgi:PHD/YefM family antitoxin component YafN of YafNO toxin-antitoxin module